ncbi:MAG TPA: tRNA pseudouridine(13) synthase TruD [Methanoregulaceae archaeon]|nr:tRNA pseudouridine(13) synthase TruD [Methanoregulaceae archaeon]
MMKSRVPLERDLGMHYYASETEGVGGVLRSTADDFRVDEIPVDVGNGGPYLICRLEKRDWELQHAVKELAKRLGISHRRIGFGGTKDRHAVTSQLISLYNVTPEQIGLIRLKDITIEVLGHSQHALSLGSLKGNRFGIVIRDLEGCDLAAQVASVTGTVAEGLPNYYGIQRFGVIRPLTHLVGECILKGDFESAVTMYIGKQFPDEPENIRIARNAFFESRDPASALHDFPVPLSYERAMLHHLVGNPLDYKGALQVLPPKLLSMFVSAFQSYLFNCALSVRFDDGFGLNEPVPGDRLIFDNGREDFVTAQNVTLAGRHIQRGKCRIALFMPGALGDKNCIDPVTGALLRDHGITSGDFEKAQSFVRTRFNGALRSVSLSTYVEAVLDHDTLRLDFALPPGHYATTVCREYMKTDPLRMI